MFLPGRPFSPRRLSLRCPIAAGLPAFHKSGAKPALKPGGLNAGGEGRRVSDNTERGLVRRPFGFLPNGFNEKSASITMLGLLTIAGPRHGALLPIPFIPARIS
jgi:hypothetical protein